MKKLAIILTLLTCVSYAQQPKDRFVLNGSVNQKDRGIAYMHYQDQKDKPIKDSCTINDGRFSFTGSLAEPSVAYLRLKINNNKDQSDYLPLFIEPAAMEVKINLQDFMNPSVTGSSVHKEYEILSNSKNLVESKYKPLLDSMKIEKDESRLKKLEERLDPYYKEVRQKELDFFKQHPESYVTAYSLQFLLADIPLDSAQLYYNRLGKKLQNRSIGKEITKEIQQVRDSSPGSMAKDFVARDINGETLELHKFKGKYVLLDFWASWCGPCRKGNPHLVELYNRYKGKDFEIIGISDDDSKPEAWKNAVEKDGIGIWKHVLRGLKRTPEGFDKTADISEGYGIKYLPTKILIDRNGVIIGRYVGDDKALDEKLKEVFSK